ncbi:unnamed protein product [Staurois parvus]|uniref:Uncharacterized protein n=1 Tax=Staurois parvus TaxID=386267 RepID=A0ABN9D4B8_9NEOB|nr:unnamed protein product [Staurois parvus]
MSLLTSLLTMSRTAIDATRSQGACTVQNAGTVYEWQPAPALPPSGCLYT